MNTVIRTTDPRGVTTVMLNRPDKHNALNAELVDALHNTLIEAEQDSETRIVVLTGAGKSFCAGADTQHMLHVAKEPDSENFRDALALARCLRKLDELNKPVIARVNGNAFGGGLGLIACADIAIASDQAKFCFSEVKLGLAAATIAPYVIAALGSRITRRLLLTAVNFDAKQAWLYGLLHQLSGEQQLDMHIEAEVNLLLAGGPSAQQASKQLVRDVVGLTSEDRDLQMAKTARLLARLRTGAEAREGLQAFMEKRKPDWSR